MIPGIRRDGVSELKPHALDCRLAITLFVLVVVNAFIAALAMCSVRRCGPVHMTLWCACPNPNLVTWKDQRHVVCLYRLLRQPGSIMIEIVTGGILSYAVNGFGRIWSQTGYLLLMRFSSALMVPILRGGFGMPVNASTGSENPVFIREPKMPSK